MVFRISNKINSLIVQNASRSLASKINAATAAETETAPKKTQPNTADEGIVSTPEPTPVPAPFSPLGGVRAGQYEVCRPRTSPLTIKRDVHNESEIAKKTVALQYLQPAMLPSFYNKPGEAFNGSLYAGQDTETSVKNLAKQREFDDSVTRMNVTLPLKPPKLAKPFPDPVKTMCSHTTSDQEKAEHMLAETKMMRTYANNMKKQQQEKQKQSGQTGTSAQQQQGARNYSTFPKSILKDANYIRYVRPLPQFATDRKDECKKPPDQKKEPCGWVKKREVPHAKKPAPVKNQSDSKTRKTSAGFFESAGLSKEEERLHILLKRLQNRDRFSLNRSNKMSKINVQNVRVASNVKL